MVQTDKENLKYDYLVLASGGRPRKITNIPGHQLDNIFQLRTPQDGNRIVEKAKGQNVVVVGSSFIGTEVASYLADKAASVTIVCRGEYPLEKALGVEVAKFVKSLHESKGVKFAINAEVESFSAGSDGKSVGSVTLKGQNDPLKADLVVLGIGVEPTTQYLAHTNILDEAGNVLVNDFLQVPQIPNIFAGGDIAHFPLNLATIQTKVSIGHWQIAQNHGRLIGLNIGADTLESVKTVPFFWTVQYGKSLRYAGHAPEYDDILYEGNVADGSFVAYYCQGENVMAVATLGRDPVAADFANLLLCDGLIKKNEAVNGQWRNK